MRVRPQLLVSWAKESWYSLLGSIHMYAFLCYHNLTFVAMMSGCITFIKGIFCMRCVAGFVGGADYCTTSRNPMLADLTVLSIYQRQ